MRIIQLLNRLKFDNDFIFDEQICAESFLKPNPIKRNRDWYLAFDL